MSQPVHLSDWAQQPDVRIACDQSWTTPAWGSEEETDTGTEGVYKADDGRLYTFDPARATCPACAVRK